MGKFKLVTLATILLICGSLLFVGCRGATYTITFDSMGGSEVVRIRAREGSLATQPNDPTRGGYTFRGWYLDTEFEEPWHWNDTTARRNVTLFARWFSRSATVTTEPTASNLTFGASLSHSQLTGGEAVSTGGTVVTGWWAWQNLTVIPTVHKNGFNVIFTPFDTVNFDSVIVPNVPITVARATPTISESPVASSMVHGFALSTSELTGGIASVPGTFEWENGDIMPSVINSGFRVRFVPQDTDNFNTVLLPGFFDVTVKPVHTFTLQQPNQIRGSISMSSAAIVDGEDAVLVINLSHALGYWLEEIIINGTTVTSGWTQRAAGVYEYTFPDVREDFEISVLISTVSFSITYHQNGGTGATNRTYNIESDTITLPTEMTRTDMFFIGWYTNPEFTGTPVTQIPQGSTGSREFWARWWHFEIEVIDGIEFNLIGTRELLERARNMVNDTNFPEADGSGMNIRLTADIDLQGSMINQWTPIGSGIDGVGRMFGGIFDGNGKTVSGLFIEVTSGDVSFIPAFIGSSSGLVKNLTVTGQVTNSVITAGAAGIVGYNHGIVRNVANKVDVTGTRFAGGVVGINMASMITEQYSQILNSVNHGAITATFGDGAAGGIAGENSAEATFLSIVYASENFGIITAPRQDVPGIIGRNDGVFES